MANRTPAVGRRSVVGVIFFLVLTLVVVSPMPPPASARDLSAAELCELFPQDLGYTIVERPAFPRCDATRGDCDRPASDAVTCITGSVGESADSQEARGMALSIVGDGTSVSGLGEMATEDCDESGCTLAFQRGKFWMFALSAQGQSQAARDLAARVDLVIELLVSPAAQSAQSTTTTSPAAAQPQASANDPFVAVLRIFADEAGLEGLIPRINELTNCAEPKFVQGGLVKPGIGDCPGQQPGWESAVRFEREFKTRVPNHSLNEEAMKDRLVRATILAGMVGPGDQPLFPSILTAMPVIKKLADMSRDPDYPLGAAAYAKREEESLRAVQRLLDLLAANDALQWERRFP